MYIYYLLANRKMEDFFSLLLKLIIYIISDSFVIIDITNEIFFFNTSSITRLCSFYFSSDNIVVGCETIRFSSHNVLKSVNQLCGTLSTI